MAQIFAGGMEIERRIYVELTGISSEVEGSVTSSIPPGFPLDRSFARLVSGIEWNYANGLPFLTLERTGVEELTWHHFFPDIYNLEDYSSLIFTAEVMLFTTPPKSIQQVSINIDYTPNGAWTLTSNLSPSVDPERALVFVNSVIRTNYYGYQVTTPEITSANQLSWKVKSNQGQVTRTLRAVVIDPN